MIKFNFYSIEIKIYFGFVAVVTLFLLLDKTGLAIISLLACFTHELGHIITFFLFKKRPRTLSFDIDGIELIHNTNHSSQIQTVIILLSGSILNFVVFVTIFFIQTTILKLNFFAVTNLVVGIFNILPCSNFDGGKLLEILLLKFFVPDKVALICKFINNLVLLLAIVFCFILLIKNITFNLLIMLLYLIICFLLVVLKRI